MIFGQSLPSTVIPAGEAGWRYQDRVMRRLAISIQTQSDPMPDEAIHLGRARDVSTLTSSPLNEPYRRAFVELQSMGRYR